MSDGVFCEHDGDIPCETVDCPYADPIPGLSAAAKDLYEAALVSVSWGHQERCAKLKGAPECDCGYEMMRAAVKKARGE